MDFGQPNVSFALNLIIDSEARKHSLKNLLVETDCMLAKFCLSASLASTGQLVKTIFENFP